MLPAIALRPIASAPDVAVMVTSSIFVLSWRARGIIGMGNEKLGACRNDHDDDGGGGGQSQEWWWLGLCGKPVCVVEESCSRDFLAGRR